MNLSKSDFIWLVLFILLCLILLYLMYEPVKEDSTNGKSSPVIHSSKKGTLQKEGALQTLTSNSILWATIAKNETDLISKAIHSNYAMAYLYLIKELPTSKEVNKELLLSSLQKEISLTPYQNKLINNTIPRYLPVNIVMDKIDNYNKDNKDEINDLPVEVSLTWENF